MSAEHADGSWTVRVDPHGLEFDCRHGENVMAAATPAGYVWPTACDGTAHCALCSTRVVDGPEHLDEPSQIEVGLLKTLAARRLHGDSVRRACQAGVRGDLAVHKSGVRPRDASDAALAPLRTASEHREHVTEPGTKRDLSRRQAICAPESICSVPAGTERCPRTRCESIERGCP